MPRDLSDGAMALGAQWERSAASRSRTRAPASSPRCSRPGRAFGEGIAVTQVIGAGSGFPGSVFDTGNAANRIASEYQGAVTGLQIDSILYLAAILLVISLVTNVAAQAVVRRFERSRGKIT